MGIGVQTLACVGLARVLIGAVVVAMQLSACRLASAAEEGLPTPPQSGASGSNAGQSIMPQWRTPRATPPQTSSEQSNSAQSNGGMSSMEFADELSSSVPRTVPPQSNAPAASQSQSRGGMSSMEFANPPAARGTMPRMASPTAPTSIGTTAIRSGGILNESFNYHHPQPMRSAIEMGCIPQATGWYNYGFPMQSYRWGYFGAERHYPRVMWHQGYYGDKIRTAYRYAY